MAGRLGLATAILLAVGNLQAQRTTPNPDLRFEAAAIARILPDARAPLGAVPGTPQDEPGRFIMRSGSVRDLIFYAFPIEGRDILGAPEWVRSERYTVTAKPGSSSTTREEFRIMVRNLLADRMRLRTHYTKQLRDAFALVRVRSDGQLGPEMKRSTRDCMAEKAAFRPETLPPVVNGVPACHLAPMAGGAASGGITMDEFAMWLWTPARAGRMVINKTGLDGFYEFRLAFTTRLQLGVNGGPSLFTALDEQLGLRLAPIELPVEVLVVDHIEKPTDN